MNFHEFSVSQLIGFTYDICEETAYGAELSTGKWTGLVDSINRTRAALTISGFYVTEKYAGLITYINPPFAWHSVKMLMRMSSNNSLNFIWQNDFKHWI